MKIADRTLAAAGILLILLGCGVGVALPAGSGWDFANFYDAGHKALVGQIADLYDPQSLIDGEAPQGHMAFWSVPAASYLLAPMALFSPGVAMVLFKLQNTVALLLALYLLHQQALRFLPEDAETRNRFSAIFVWLALIFQPLWTVFRVGGQTTPTILLLLAAALFCHTRQRWWLSSLCYVLAVILKPSFVLGLAFLVAVSGWPFFVAAATWGLGLAGLAVALMGWPIHWTFVQQLLQTGERSTAWMYNSALTVPFENLRMLWVPGETTHSRPAFLTLGIQLVRATVLALFAWLGYRTRSLPGASRWHATFLLSVLFALLAGPVIWEHYLALLFIPLSYLLAVRSELDRTATVAFALIFLFAIGQNLILVLWLRDHLTLDSAPELLAMGLFKAAPLIFTLVLLARPSGGLLTSYAHAGWQRMALEAEERTA